MEGGSLFNPGFLGGNFLWWVGQVADDSTWRDNHLAGKFEGSNTVPGWGRRYKVRIIGLHDKEEETIPSDQLPWAQVMYPITAGGGQTNAKQTPNIRQGNFVFGFFLDGQDQQVPVIMGILGNNDQTSLKTTIGKTDTNFGPTSGYAEGTVPKEPAAREKVPDEDLTTSKPTGTTQSNSNSGSSITASQPGAAMESIANPHRLSSSDVKRDEKYQEKIVLMKPDDVVGSAIKAIQTALDNMLSKIDKYLNAISSYIDAVSNTVDSLQSVIHNASCEIAKYMKIIFDKVMEYALKLLNTALTKAVAALPSSMRFQFADIKDQTTELILCLYNKMTSNLCGMIESLLNGAIKPDDIEQQVRDQASKGGADGEPTKPNVPMCYAESLVGDVMASKKSEIDDANNNLLDNVNAFIDDIQSQMAGVSNALGDINGLIGDIGGSMTSALQFQNVKMNIFGCELDPTSAVSDFYTFGGGGAGQPDSQTPSTKSIGDNVANSSGNVTTTEEKPFAEPPSNQEDVDLTLY